MGTRANVDGDNYRRTTSLPDDAAFSISMWINRRVDTTHQEVLATLEAASPNGNLMLIGTDETFTLVSDGVGTGSGVTATVNTWFWIAITCAGPGGSNLVGYVSSASSTSITTWSRAGNAAYTPTLLCIGDSDLGTINFDGDMAAVKIWDAVLTQAELELERWFYVPVRTANLHLWTPLLSTVNDETDISGNARDWTVQGVFDDATSPPIAWRAPTRRAAGFAPAVPAPTSGGAYAQSIVRINRGVWGRA